MKQLNSFSNLQDGELTFNGSYEVELGFDDNHSVIIRFDAVAEYEIIDKKIIETGFDSCCDNVTVTVTVTGTELSYNEATIDISKEIKELNIQDDIAKIRTCNDNDMLEKVASSKLYQLIAEKIKSKEILWVNFKKQLV